MTRTSHLPPLLLRADAGVSMGTGHLMRCLALAQTWRASGGQTTFVSCCANAALVQRLAAAGGDCVRLAQAYPARLDLDTTLATLARLAAQPGVSSRPWLGLDGYHFDAAYQQAIRAAGYGLLVLDDMAHLPEYTADILLNQNLHATALRYHCNPEATLLLGPRYALLRPEFLAWRGGPRHTPEVARKVLVTLGGSDPDNATQLVVQALQHTGVADLEVLVVLGAGYPHALPTWPQRSGFNCTVLRAVHHMPALMAWADVAVSASGSTCWELACMGLPAALVILAENQQPVACALQAAGMALSLGWASTLSLVSLGAALRALLLAPERRADMTQRGQDLVDGQGARRVVRQIMADTVRLRPVRAEDCRLLWTWANDPVVRQASFTSAPIPWEQHVQWFAARLDDRACTIYIAMLDQGTPIGQVRCEIAGQEACISVSLDKNFRQYGYGSIIIHKASQQCLQSSRVQVIHAYIKRANTASIRAFRTAGFVLQGRTTVRGCQAVHLSLAKEGSR